LIPYSELKVIEGTRIYAAVKHGISLAIKATAAEDRSTISAHLTLTIATAQTAGPTTPISADVTVPDSAAAALTSEQTYPADFEISQSRGTAQASRPTTHHLILLYRPALVTR
jgi:hypothetical protein